MKTITIPILILATTIWFTTAMSAQENVRFGLRLGTNMANVASDAIDTKRIHTLVVGGLADIPISGGFSFQPELQYAQKGYEVGFAFFGIGVETRVKLSYIELPLHIKYSLSQSDKVAAHLVMGPALAFAIEGSEETCNFGDCNKMDVSLDNFNTFDVGISLGAGVIFANAVLLDFRYNIGLTNVSDNPLVDVSNSKNRVAQLSLGYLF